MSLAAPASIAKIGGIGEIAGIFENAGSRATPLGTQQFLASHQLAIAIEACG